MTKAAVAALNEKIGDFELPAMPSIANRVNVAVASRNATPRTLAALIEADPGITAHVLRACNSAAFGFSRKITSLAQAVKLLGFDQIRDLVVAFSVRYLFKRFGPVEKKLWNHAQAVALVSRWMAGRFAPQSAEASYLAGLMHDVGEVLMVSWSPTAFRSTQTNNSMQRLALERTAFGFDHAEVGAALIQRWGLPYEIEVAVRHHVQPVCAEVESRENAPLACCVSLADQICEHLDDAVSGTVEVVPDAEEAMAMLGLPQTEFETLTKEAGMLLEGERPELLAKAG